MYLNNTATEQDIDAFVTIDNVNSHVFQYEILEEANFFWRKNENITSDEYESMGVIYTSQRLQATIFLITQYLRRGVVFTGNTSSCF